MHEKHILLMYKHIKQVVSARKMMCFTQNDWSQCDIINKNIFLTKRGKDTIHAVILMKCHKYFSTKILKHANVLAKVDKFT